MNWQSVNKESTSTIIPFCTCVGILFRTTSPSQIPTSRLSPGADKSTHICVKRSRTPPPVDEDRLFPVSVAINNKWVSYHWQFICTHLRVSICGTLNYKCTLCLYTASHNSQDGETISINSTNVAELQIGCVMVNAWSGVTISYTNTCSKPLQPPCNCLYL